MLELTDERRQLPLLADLVKRTKITSGIWLGAKMMKSWYWSENDKLTGESENIFNDMHIADTSSDCIDIEPQIKN